MTECARSDSIYFNPAAAEHARVCFRVVADDRLPRRDRKLRLVEFDVQPPLRQQRHRGRLGRRRCSESGRSSAAARRLRLRVRPSSQFTSRAVSSRRYNSSRSPITTRRESGSIRTTNLRSPSATPSPFRCPTVKPFDAAMPADDRAVASSPSRRRGRPSSCRRTNSSYRSCVTKQISWLSFFSATRRPKLSRHRANRRLLEPAHRQHHPRQAAPAECQTAHTTDPSPHRRRAAAPTLPSASRFQPRVVPRRHELGPDAVRIVEQLAELDPVVALHARIRRPPGRVLGDEVVDDLAELFLQIQRVERNAKLVGHAPRILRIGRRAAALLVIEPRNNRQRRQTIPAPCSLLPAPCSAAHATGDCSPWRMKTPITSWPASVSRWAATLESTPPLMASTTRDILSSLGPPHRQPQAALVAVRRPAL